MARVSFIDRVQPSKARSKLIDWPFLVDGETPRVRMKVLWQDLMEAATIEAMDYFRAQKKKIEEKDSVFIARERVCLLWRAFEDEDGQPLAPSSEALALVPQEILAPLYGEWSRFQSDVATRPLTQKHMDELVEGLKKNTLGDLLHALPLSWLTALCITLASQLAASTTESAPGL